jgi:hypothetical protein
MHEYNSSLDYITLREYGRNVQNIVQFIKQQPDKEVRTRLTYTLVELMKQVSPTVKDYPEYEQKLWDDIFIMAEFDLDVDSPFPMPEPTLQVKPPGKVDYPKNNIRYKHYGRSVELLVKNAMEIEDPEERENAIIYLGKLMKTFFSTWNKDSIDDGVILKNIKELSGGKLYIDIEKVKAEGLFESNIRERQYEREAGVSGVKSGGHRNKNKGRSNKHFKKRRN